MYWDEDPIVFPIDDTDIYTEGALEHLEDDDELSLREAAFMQGYNSAG
jgi:hypothetical protein